MVEHKKIFDGTRLTAGAPTILARPGLCSAPPRQAMAKRAIDVVGATMLLVLLAPLLALIALAVRMGSPGPALYVQRRVGRDGTPFDLLKFRSMVDGAHAQRSALVGSNETDGPTFKMTGDPRVTRIGRVLRRCSLDELPQLINVVQGSMSLVGPRPPLPEEVAAYTPHQWQRLLVQPGLTCIWQVSGRSDICFDRWIEMDLDYIANWSLAKDLQILCRTLPAVVSGRGAR